MRCFICKAELFGHMNRLAVERGFKNLVAGTDLDDSQDDRPVFEVTRRYGIK